MTIASAIPAAVVSMAVLRALGGGGILENNIVQTGASAGSSIASGRHLHDPGARDPRPLDSTSSTLWVLAIAGTRRHPGRAVLRAAAARADRGSGDCLPRRQSCSRGAARRRREPGRRECEFSRISALVRRFRRSSIGRERPAALPRYRDRLRPGFVGKYLVAYFGMNLSPALLGVGYIVGLNVGAAGGARRSIISWNIAIPLYGAYLPAPEPGNAPRRWPRTLVDERDRIRVTPRSRLIWCAPRGYVISVSARCSSAASGH